LLQLITLNDTNAHARTRTRTHTHTHTHSVVLLLTRHRPVAGTSTCQYTTFTRDRQACPGRDSNT